MWKPVHAHCADVSREPQVIEMFEKMVKQFGAIVTLINNSGLQNDAPFDEMTLDHGTLSSQSIPGNFLCAHEAIRCFKS
jgi:glucose 1-dehydrogenase